MAGDIQALLRQHLKVEGPVLLVGHDIGAMIALAFALRFRSEVAQLVLIDAPLQGTTQMEQMRGDPRGWHVAFHSARDIAELLVQGRERAYLQYMIGVRINDPSAIPPEDFDVYVRAYEAAGPCGPGSRPIGLSTQTLPPSIERLPKAGSCKSR
jgi:pimeloyl-ACP methyl ester carboxylesterase